MLDIKFIRENPEIVKKTISDKQLEGTVDVDELLKLDKILRDLTHELDQIRRERNELNDQIKSASDENRKELVEKSTNLKPKEKDLEDKVASNRLEYQSLLLALPNVTDPSMPVGKDEDDNVVIKTVGEVPEFDFEARDHVDLGKLLDVIDVEKSGEISGSRFYYLKNEAVLLQFALINHTFSVLGDSEIVGKVANEVGNPSDKPFSPMLPPVMMNPSVMKKMDRLDPIDDRYELKLDDLILVGSAEHTMGPYHMNETFMYDDLPIRYIGYSTAFRREAGSHGRDVRGILRAHQFDKLEMETFVPIEYGNTEQALIVKLQEYLVHSLDIPYELIQICTGDTGKPDYNQFDINCWIPSQQTYRETHTSDYMTDFQSRRLNIRYSDKSGKKEFVYMNDATAFAIGRILIAILENNQQKDGSVVVPDVLRKYTGFDVIKPK